MADDGRRVPGDEPAATCTLDAAEPPILAVVRAVAAVRDREPTALPALYDAVDPDALARLVGGSRADEGDRWIRVTFAYAGTTVAVDSTGRIDVYR